MQKLNKERSVLEKDIAAWKSLSSRSEDAMVLLEMSIEAGDEGSFQEVVTEAAALEAHWFTNLKSRKMLSGELDQNSTYISINSGAGGTEAQDWAEMLYRMYMRYGEKHGYKVQEIERSDGEAAGIQVGDAFDRGPLCLRVLEGGKRCASAGARKSLTIPMLVGTRASRLCFAGQRSTTTSKSISTWRT
jgi:peptide chain release factor 2